MATTYTTNYNLGKQENHADKFDMDVITDNADKIDAALTGLQSGIDGKQATLTTEQLAAVNSGITSTDVEQIQTNKTNILYNTNNGVKNLAKPYGSSDTNNNVTYTYNSDGTISVKSNSATHNQSSKRVATFTAPYAGKFYINGIPTGASNDTFFLNITAEGGINRNIFGDDEVNPTTAGFTYNIDIYVRANVEVDTTFSIMFRPASISDSTYQPFALSNAELTASLIPTTYTVPTGSTQYGVTILSGGYFKVGKLCVVNVRITNTNAIPNNTYFLYDLPEAVIAEGVVAGSSICALSNKGLYLTVTTQGNVLNASGAQINAGETFVLSGCYLCK